MLLLLPLSCAEPPCPEGSVRGDDGLCYLVDEARPRPYAMIAPTAIDAMEVLRALHKKSGCVPLVHYDVELDRNVFLFDATEVHRVTLTLRRHLNSATYSLSPTA